MDVLLTAVNASGSGERLRSAGVGGMTLTSEPVSTRKRVWVGTSLTKKRRLEVGPVTPIAASVRPKRFPSCRAPGTSWPLHQISCGCCRGQWGRGCGCGFLSIGCGLFEGGVE